ncbi:ferredoxin [Spirillospora sp. CA-142024]|uniref:ferredoxin n=1 Tax=Spirillospora sp. CA-142024 TaxID=3240036 RepID=UPI003D8FBC86
MRVTVDPTRCQGHALCVMNAPGVFDLDDEGHAGVLTDPVPERLGKAAREAEGGCPERAITIEQQPRGRRGQEG